MDPEISRRLEWVENIVQKLEEGVSSLEDGSAAKSQKNVQLGDSNCTSMSKIDDTQKQVLGVSTDEECPKKDFYSMGISEICYAVSTSMTREGQNELLKFIMDMGCREEYKK